MTAMHIDTSANKGASLGKGVVALLLSAVLLACHAPADGQGTGAVATSPEDATAATASAPESPIGGTTVAEAEEDEDDLVPKRPDDSYRMANLRPEYDRCIEAADAVTPELLVCGQEELEYQEKRLEEAFARMLAMPDSEEKDALLDAQAAYMHDTNRHCAPHPEQDGQGQLLDAQSCRINRVANRVEALQALELK